MGTAFGCALPLVPAMAGATVTFGDDQSLSVGFGLRTSFTSQEHAAPDGTSRSKDFNLDDFRLYISGSLNQYIKGTFNTERKSDGTVELMDGIAQFEFMDGFNIWAGRLLPPSDRSNLDGPFYLSSWLFPGLVSQFPAVAVGRDDGVTTWGKLFDKKLVYSVGVFSGHNNFRGASSQGDNLLMAARVAYNFWDPEPDPAYYTSSTYYGAVDVLTLAIATQYQKDGVGTATLRGDYTAVSVDGLLEKKLGSAGVATLEGSYNRYNTGGVADVATNFNGAGDTANVGGITEGKAYLISAAYLLPQKVGWGQFQPFFRYQNFDYSLTSGSAHQYDGGVNYVIKGHNARLSADYSYNETPGSRSYNSYIVGLQVQY